MRKYIHPYERNVERELEKLEEIKISKRNKAIILRYYEAITSQGISLPRTGRVLITLRQTACFVKKDFDKIKLNKTHINL